jgi:cell division protein FtsN
MTTDYKSRASRNQKKSLPGYAWLLSGLFIGLFVAFIVYLDNQPESDKDFGSAVQKELEKLKQQAKKSNTVKAGSPATTESAAENTGTKKAQKFNFYTLLPELEILIPESETRPPAQSETIYSRQSNNAGKKYILQVGSFQNLVDAEKLKANLAFLGLEAEIQHVTVNNSAWHRVRTGPFQDKQQLYKNQNLLKQNDINFISMELK